MRSRTTPSFEEVEEADFWFSDSLINWATSDEEIALSAYYLSFDRVLGLLGNVQLPPAILAALRGGEIGMSKAILSHAVGRYLIDQIRTGKTRSLTQLAFAGDLKPGVQFIYEGHMFGKGFGATKSPHCHLYEKLDEPLSGRKLLVEFSKNGLVNDTAYTRLSGSVARLFIFGYITKIGETIRAVPYIIGDLTLRGGSLAPFLTPSLELRLEEVTQFSSIDTEWFPSKEELSRLKQVPERQVKELICRLLGEHTVPADWGGEESDLFTANLLIAGKRHTGAFLLKGPSAYHTMQPKDLGKNGDQIYRLAKIPADVFVVQHCHHIGAAVRHQLEAAALQRYFVAPCRFMFIDGLATARLLRAHGEWPKSTVKKPKISAR
jgi:hypothetical protein